MICEQTFTIMKERTQDGIELVRFDFSSSVLVLRLIRLGDIVPDLKSESAKGQHAIKYDTHLHTTNTYTQTPARRTIAFFPLTLLLC